MADLPAGAGPVLVLLLTLLVLVTGCGGEDEGATSAADRETFVATWVDLRLAALESPRQRLDPTERDRILEEHGTSEGELLRFVDAHGEDISYMEDVWLEVEARMDSLSQPADTTG